MSAHTLHLQNIELLLERRSEQSIYMPSPFKKKHSFFHPTKGWSVDSNRKKESCL